MSRAMSSVVLAAAVVCVGAVGSLAQQTTSTETKAFEIIAVDGNQLVVRLPEGTRELAVPDDFRFIVDGQPLSVRELKVGMKGTATITTRTTMTPVTVTEVKNGTVIEAKGSTIVVQTDTETKRFSQGDVDKRGVTIVRDGKPAKISDFREGDRLSATIITTRRPQVLTEREVQATLAAARTPAAAPTAPEAALRAAATPEVTPPPQTRAQPRQTEAQTTVATRTLPNTATSWPLVGLASVVSLTVGLVLTTRRRLVR